MWKTSYEEAINEAKMLKTLNAIKSLVWHRAGEEIEKIRDNLKFFLEFHRLQKEDEYLKRIKKEIQDRNGIT